MADENKEIETINTADDKKRKIAGLKQSLQSIFGASKRRPLLLVHISAGIIISIIFIYYTFFRHNYFINGPEMLYDHGSTPAVVKLQNGNILVLGGNTQNAEIYDVKQNKFFATKGKLNYIRSSGSNAILLKDGAVLITGGANSSPSAEFKGAQDYIPVSEAEIYDANNDSFSIISKMQRSRSSHIAIGLNNGNVLFFGGWNNRDEVKDVEEYDYNLKNFNLISELQFQEQSCMQIIKVNEKELFFFGNRLHWNLTKNPYFVQRYNFANHDFKNTEIKYSHCNSAGLMLNNDRIIITGGMEGITGTSSSDKVTIYDYKKGVFEENKLQMPLSEHSINLLKNGNAVIIGGNTGENIFEHKINETEIYDSKTNSFYKNKAYLNKPRSGHISIPLDNGKLLILGGEKGNNKSTELYIL